MTQDEITTSLLEKYDDCEYKDSDIFKISYLTSYLTELVNRKELFDFLVKIEEDKLFIYLKKRKASHIHTFEIKSYFREQRLKKILNK